MQTPYYSLYVVLICKVAGQSAEAFEEAWTLLDEDGSGEVGLSVRSWPPSPAATILIALDS